MPKTYQINELFYSLQGEGLRAGTANIFIRTTGCNLACDMEPSPKSPGGWSCDTEFVSGRPMTAQAIVESCQELAPQCRAIILTGGEPALQVDLPLVETLRQAGYYLAMETNGTVDVTSLELDWVCVSPKTAEHTLKQSRADEVKYVRHAGQGIPRPAIEATHHLISPAFEPDGTVQRATLAWCIQLCKEHPQWRLSMQQHKMWRVR